MKPAEQPGQPLRALIVDDEPLARRGLQIRLKEIEGVEVIGECKNGREAIAAATSEQPDLIFLDIQMPGLDGFDVIRELQSDDMPLVVFVTAFDHYAVNAFETHAVDYLLKPVEPARLQAAVYAARERFDQARASNSKERLLNFIVNLTGKSEQAIEELVRSDTSMLPTRLTIKDGNETIIVPVETIDWVDAAGDYMCVHAEGATHVMRITMKQLESLLDPSLFQRVHRSTIVNVKCIKKLISHINGEYFLSLENGTRLKMSRTYKDKVQLLIS